MNKALRRLYECTHSYDSQFGRVVKAWDLKSHGVTRAGSNPAADAIFSIYFIPIIQI